MLRSDRLVLLASGPLSAARLHAASPGALLGDGMFVFEGGARGRAACGRRGRFGPRTTLLMWGAPAGRAVVASVATFARKRRSSVARLPAVDLRPFVVILWSPVPGARCRATCAGTPTVIVRMACEVVVPLPTR